jgi:hypothetical protein
MSKRKRNPSEPLTKQHGNYSRNGPLRYYIIRPHYKPILLPPCKRPVKARTKVRVTLTLILSRSKGISKHRRRTNGRLTSSLNYSFASDRVSRMLCFICPKIGTRWYRQRCTIGTSFKQSREQRTTRPAQQTKDITPLTNRDIENGLASTGHPPTLVGAEDGTVEASEDEVVIETQIPNHIQTGVSSAQSRMIASETMTQLHKNQTAVSLAGQQTTGGTSAPKIQLRSSQHQHTREKPEGRCRSRNTDPSR